MSSLLFADTETTGLKAESSELVEIAAMRCHRESVYPFSRIQLMVNPQMKIPQAAMDVHHITDAMVKYADPPSIALNDFFSFLRDDDIIVGHNFKKFDVPFMEKHGHKIKNEIIDTLELAIELGFERGNRSLQCLKAHFNLTTSATAHRAMADVDLNRKIYMELMKMKPNTLF